MTDDATLARARAIVTASPLTPFSEAISLAERQIAEETAYQSIEAVKVDEMAWVAAGRPGGINALFNGSWRDLVEGQIARAGITSGTSEELIAGLEAQYGSSPLSQGGFDHTTKARIEKAWDDQAAADLKTARDAGRVAG